MSTLDDLANEAIARVTAAASSAAPSASSTSWSTLAKDQPTCDICGKTFSRAANLEQHKRETHEGVKVRLVDNETDVHSPSTATFAARLCVSLPCVD